MNIVLWAFIIIAGIYILGAIVATIIEKYLKED